MIERFQKNLAWRMALYFGILMTVSLVLLALVSFMYERRHLQEAVFERLSGLRETQKERLQEYLKERLDFVRLIARSREVAELMAFAAELQSSGGTASEDLSSRRYGLLAQRAHARLSSDETSGGFEDLVLFLPDKPKIVYAAREGLKTSLEDAAFAKRLKTLEPVWKQAVKKNSVVLADLSFYDPVGKPCFFIGTPVKDEQGTVSAVLVAALNIEHLKHIVEQKSGLGLTGDTYVVGFDGLLRTPSRFLSEGEILKKKVETEAVRRALTGQTGHITAMDYRGQEVLSVFGPVGLKETLSADFDWVLLVEMDAAEAFSAVRQSALRYGLLTVFLVVCAVAAGFLTARAIVSPLRRLRAVIADVAQGNLSVSIEETLRADEVGDLMRGFGAMLDSLKGQTRQIVGGVNDLAASISQISATAAQLAASSAETATSISEITATVEEVRQTARLSHDKAKQVAQRSETLAQTSHEGRQVTDDVLKGLQRIREEMEFVAENVMRLSEQGQSIGDIIDVVRDLADQVNLLSVNAAIEAAKAGDHGKGFAVVAQEMRSLADQSKEATEQVKQILSEIQKATGGAVMAIERGTKAVAAGLDLGQRAGDAIGRLAQGVEEASDSALQIASSSQEQLVGMEQVVLAVQNIREAGVQNTEAARQLEAAVRDLERLSRTLTEIASRLRV
ncbi:MAG: methyl-accepting chemotaxis protein [Desulfosoma sp.]